MLEVAWNYDGGLDGFKEDHKLAFEWFKRAHEAGNVKGTACLGECYLFGDGVAMCFMKGMAYVSSAAGQGSNFAAYSLGMAFARGTYGLDTDKGQAMYWLKRAVGDCPHNHLCEEYKAQAQEKLDELTGELDNQRVEQEIVILTQKADVDEELTELMMRNEVALQQIRLDIRKTKRELNMERANAYTELRRPSTSAGHGDADLRLY